MKTVVLLAAGLVGLALASSAARADTPPSVWDKAKDPSLSEHWALHVRVERLLSGPPRDDETPHLEAIGDAERRTMAALAMLEDAGAADSPDVMLRFDLGTVLFELADRTGRVDLYTKAARVLESALRMSPDGPGSTQAFGRLADVYAKLDRPSDEIATWRRYIPRLLDPRARAVDTMNLGEAEMRIGRVDDALTTLREVLVECGSLPNASSTYTLTLWDVAVALDRTGDSRGALETARQAARQTAVDSRGNPVTGRQLLKEDPAVFFVPAWEKHWYLALASEAASHDDRDPREAAMYLIEAENEWDDYIKGASGETARADASLTRRDGEDPMQAARQSWLRIAHLRRARVHAELEAARKRLPKSARLPTPDTE